MYIRNPQELNKALFHINSEIEDMSWSIRVFDSIRGQLDYLEGIHNSRHIVIRYENGATKILTRTNKQ